MSSASDAVKFWLDSAGRYPVLTKEQVLLLARQIQENPKGSKIRQRAIDKLVKHNLKLIPKIARRAMKNKSGRFFSANYMEDVLQCGVIGLTRAAELYDPTRGYAFSTYAVPWIYQAIQRDLYNNLSPIRVPENTVWEYYKYYEKIINKESVSDIPQQKVHRYNDCALALMCKSIDKFFVNGHDDEGGLEALSVTSNIVNEIADTVEELLAMSSKPDFDKDLVKAHVIDGVTISDLCKQHGMKKEKVSRTIRRCLSDIKERMSAV